MNQNFNIIIFSENNAGLIIRIVTMISRRRIHIETLQVVSCYPRNIYRFTLVIKESEETIRKLMLQIDKQVEVFKSFYHTNEAFVWQLQEAYLEQNQIESVALVTDEIAV